jgi:hypothetical protein
VSLVPDELAARRSRLLARSARLRERLGVELEEFRAPLGVVDRLGAGWRWLRTNPQWPLAAVVVLAVVRPRRALRWAARGLWLWRVARPWWGIVRAATRSGAARTATTGVQSAGTPRI